MLKMKVYKPQLNDDAILVLPVDPETEEKVVLTLPLEISLDLITPSLEQSSNVLQRLWGRVKSVCKELVHVNKRKDQQWKQFLRPQTRQRQQAYGQCSRQQIDKEQDLTVRTMDQATQTTLLGQSPLSPVQLEHLSLVSDDDNLMTPVPVDHSAKVTHPALSIKTSQTTTAHQSTQLLAYRAHLPMVVKNDNVTAPIKVDDDTKATNPAMNNQTTQATSTNQSSRLWKKGQCTSAANDSNNETVQVTSNSALITQATQTISTYQSPVLSRKRSHSTSVGDCTKSPLVDSTNNNNSEHDSQPSTKKICMKYDPDMHIYVAATNSVTKPSPQMPFLYNSTLPPRLLRCSDCDRVGTDPPSPVPASDRMSIKRKFAQIGDEDYDLEQQQNTSSFGKDSKRILKRQRTDGQEFLAFTIWVICYLVLFIFMMVLWLSYFNSYPNLFRLT